MQKLINHLKQALGYRVVVTQLRPNGSKARSRKIAVKYFFTLAGAKHYASLWQGNRVRVECHDSITNHFFFQRSAVI